MINIDNIKNKRFYKSEKDPCYFDFLRMDYHVFYLKNVDIYNGYKMNFNYYIRQYNKNWFNMKFFDYFIKNKYLL